MNKAQQLLQRRLHRGDARDYVINFLLNFSRYARFMHEFLPIREEKQDVCQIAMKTYVIGMAACLETFFRDLYIHVLERDPKLAQRALALNPRRDGDAAINRYQADGVPPSELAAAQVSFQSADAIDKNFSIFFSGQTFFEALADFEIQCVIPSPNLPSAERPCLSPMKLFSGWQKDLARIFSLRHEFAHDGNSKTLIDPHEMGSLETTAILICQMTGYMKPFRGNLTFSDQEGVPVLLLISDLIADDWDTCDTPTEATALRRTQYWR